MESYEEFLKPFINSGIIPPNISENISSKRDELKITIDQHNQLLKKYEMTENDFKRMEEKGVSVQKYIDKIKSMLWTEFENGQVKPEEELQTIRKENEFTDQDHIFALSQIGWTIDEFEALSNGNPRNLVQYQLFLVGLLSDESVELNLVAHQQLFQMRKKYFITDIEHSRTLEKIGYTPEKFHTQRVKILKSVLESVKRKNEGTKAIIETSNKNISNIKDEIKECNEKNKPMKEKKEELENQLREKESELLPKKELSKSIQVRLNVTKQMIKKREEEIAALVQETEKNRNENIVKAGGKVQIQGEIARMRKDIQSYEEKIERRKEGIRTGTVIIDPPTKGEQRFIEFHHLCISMKISVQNHETSNILVSELWEKARDMPKEEWRDFIRSKLVPVSVEKFSGVEQKEESFFEWIANSVTNLV
eukprot:c19475_g1_i1.p1 GENE.c19475_g1_i1~~c19475_g1_i1.p1  ORF type:complete len:422 (-),score=165.47 c19475_g1_i1:64-1329(-)